MKIIPSLALSISSLLIASGFATAADDGSGRPLVGEVRSLAIATGNSDTVAELHHDGWIEARGQLVSTSAFPELFKAIGRTWTTNSVAEDRFAIPDLHDRSQRELVSSDNPFGVLGPGDLVTSGRAKKDWRRQAPISYWIFVGRDVSRIEAIAAQKR